MKYDAIEIWKEGEDGEDEFICSAIVAMKDGIPFHGEMPCRKAHIDPDVIDACLEAIPPTDIYPEFPKDFTEALPESISDTDYIKVADLRSYGLDRQGVAKLVREEARVYEYLNKQPHQNIVKYRGCVVRDGLITGLALARY